MGDLASCWDEIDKMLKNQLGEIQGSFGRGISPEPLWVSSMKNYNAVGHSILLKKIVVVCK